MNLAVCPPPDDGWRNTERARANIAAMTNEVARRIPHHFRSAVADHPAVTGWVESVVRQAVADDTPYLRVTTGPSLLMLGITGVGKTHQALGAVRVLAGSGVRFSWQEVTAADLYAGMQPRSGTDSEAVFDRYSRCDVLLLDDLAATKATLSEWREEVTYRLINHRYQHGYPTIITSNVLPEDLPRRVGDRVASRLVEMAQRVTLKGQDRRLRGVR